MKKRRIETNGLRTTLTAAAALLVVMVLSGCELLGEILGEDDGDDTQVFAEDAIGRGYNILGNYADNKEVRAPVLDFGQLLADGLVDERVIERASFETFSGSSVEEYTESLEVNVEVSGSYKGFSGSLETNFSSETYSRSEFSYATVQSEIFKRSFNVDTRSSETLRAYLTERARAELNDPSVPLDTLLSRYGSHVLLGIYVGGRLDYNMATDFSQFSSEQLVGVAANASFKNVFASAEIDVDVEYNEEIRTMEQNSQIRVNVYGGSSEFGQNILNDNDYTRWIDSVDERQIFVGFLDGQRPLVPLWEFIDDSARAAALEAAFEEIAGDTSENFTEQPMRVRVSLDRFTVVNIDDELGGRSEIELYGEVRAKGWREIDDTGSNLRFIGNTADVRLWSRDRDNVLSLPPGDGMGDGRAPGGDTRRTVEITNFNEQVSAIELIADLSDQDGGSASNDDDFSYANQVFYIRDGFGGANGQKVLEVEMPGSTMRVKAYFTLEIAR